MIINIFGIVIMRVTLFTELASGKCGHQYGASGPD